MREHIDLGLENGIANIEAALAAKQLEMEMLEDMVAQRLEGVMIGRSSPGRWLTVEETAQKLRISSASVYKMVDSGEIPSHRVGRSIRINEAELDDVLLGR